MPTTSKQFQIDSIRFAFELDQKFEAVPHEWKLLPNSSDTLKIYGFSDTFVQNSFNFAKNESSAAYENVMPYILNN